MTDVQVQWLEQQIDALNDSLAAAANPSFCRAAVRPPPICISRAPCAGGPSGLWWALR